MIREIKDNSGFKGNYKEFSGLSTDDKPYDCGVNSLFLELDTGKVYYFDGQAWNEVGGSSSGGGSDEPID